MIDIDNSIKEAMKSKDKVALNAFKNLKSEIQKYSKSKNAKPIDENILVQITAQYIKKLEDGILSFSEAGREDLVIEYRDELEVLKKLLPEPVNEQKLYRFLEKLCFEKGFVYSYLDNGAPCPMEGYKLQIPKKEMGAIIKAIKVQFPQADGKMISEIVKKYVI